ncbi:50S ribosomal protein L25/general stress protein Ctc [Octadecabacter sp.]|jgi:large subunit ribosomal protein L25|nr:50S ribosomal protein L25/general stress protein Ctc [Octadecabacter sp.]MDC1231352.1 50S ribosomal protein L25/general stress protein Ctc [Octadecabacter sp.]MDC1297197.1 50S ribosomal protein L25/general stress protein Ctc [Octadecabacter sp.]MDC1397866.1 50S ribosomal protein L25/general stress protein Ctc [Octadecabacter sp.]MDC1430435.1 50S ribosomal protein L25/general stress protein Ctc [Octadecabacter sp.]
MAGKIPDFEAQLRTDTGKGAARQARRDGLVPGVVYGGGEDPIAINVPFNVLLKRLKAGRFLSTLFNLKVEGKDDVRVICRNVQRHVVKDLPTHLDFMRLKQTTKINLFIGIEFINEDECPALKAGGILVPVRNEVELMVTAGDIPEILTVDLTGLEIGDTITISSITLPSGAKATIDRDFVIANLQAPASLTSAEDEEDDVAADDVPATTESTDE